MTYKDILLYLDDSKACEKRIAAGIELARAQDAHLTGLSLDTHISVATFVEANVPEDVLKMVRRRERERAEATAARFRETLDRAGVRGVCHVVSTSDLDAARTVAQMARYADLVVLGQVDDRESMPPGGTRLPQDVILTAGRPILMVPYIGCGESIGQQVLIAWNPGREAARAVSDALPLLKRAESVSVLSVNPVIGRGAHGEEPGADIALHLSRHGVKVNVDHITTDQVSVSDAILAFAADHDIDLIVMGAYGHSRLREVVLGGVTRQMLEHMPAPLLMSH